MRVSFGVIAFGESLVSLSAFRLSGTFSFFLRSLLRLVPFNTGVPLRSFPCELFVLCTSLRVLPQEFLTLRSFLRLAFLALRLHPRALACFDLFDTFLNFCLGLRHRRPTRPEPLTGADIAARERKNLCIGRNSGRFAATLDSCDSLDGRDAVVGRAHFGAFLAVGQVVGDPVEPVGKRMTGQIESGLSEQLPIG